MRILLAIVTSHAAKYRERAQAQRETWMQAVKDYPQITARFFLGNPPNGETTKADEIFLAVGDGYRDLPAKTKAVCAWAAENDFDFIFKTDDDVFVNLANLMRRVPEVGQDYVGIFRGPSGGYPSDYASGYAYWLSRRAVQLAADSPLNGDWAEDRWLANTLAQHGVVGWTDAQSYRACFPPVLPDLLMRSTLRYCAAVCEYPPHHMREIWRLARYTKMDSTAPPPKRVVLATGPQPNAPHDDVDDLKQAGGQRGPVSPQIINHRHALDLSDVCVLIKTFLRDGYLFDTIATLRCEYPEMKIIVVDDGYPSPIKENVFKQVRSGGGTVLQLPFDVGFGAKANAAIPYMDRPYVLIGSDDFNFHGTVVRGGIEKMLTVMRNVPSLGAASGRVDNNPYEGFLSYGPDFIRETPLKMGDWLEVEGVDYKYCDLTVNYSILRTSMLGRPGPVSGWEYVNGTPIVGRVNWEAAYKIGGEHHDFFQDIKRAGWKVAYVPGVNIDTYRHDPKKIDARYGEYRGRAIQCVGKFVRKHTGKPDLPEHWYYIDFHGNKCDYAEIARQRNL